MRIALVTLALGALGAVLARLAGAPAPLLTGPALFVTLAALGGMTVSIPLRLRSVIFLIVGINIGTAVTPEALATAARWPASLAALAAAIVVTFYGAAALLARLQRLSPMTALLAACPGHLSVVLSMSEEVEADMARVAVIQTMRVLALTLAVPAMAALLSDRPLGAGPAPAAAMSWPALAVILAVSVAAGAVLRRLGVPAALLLGAMAVTAALHGSGAVRAGVPAWLSGAAFVAMGTLIGTRFAGITPRMLLQSLGAAGLLTGFAALAALAGAAAVAMALGLPLVPALIAFAPGGLETMLAMSLLLDADPAFVAAHHVFRLLFLSVLLPWAVARRRR